MRRLVLLVWLVSGCVGDPPGTETARHEAALGVATIELRELDGSAPRASDAPPRIEVRVRAPNGVESTHRAIAAVQLAGGAAWVDEERRLLAIDAQGVVRELAAEVGGRPVADEARLAWSEPVDLAESDLRAIVGGETITIGRAPGVMSPIAIRGGSVVLVGAINGGVAGIWLAELREGGALACVTNCELRAGRPWGDAFAPPPESGESIELDAQGVSYRGADGVDRRAPLPRGAP